MTNGMSDETAPGAVPGEDLLRATDAVIDDAVSYADPMMLRGLLYQLTGDEERGVDRGDATGGHRRAHGRPRIRRGVPAGQGRVVPEGPPRRGRRGRSTSGRANGFPGASPSPSAWRKCRRRTSSAGWRSSASSRTCAG